MRGAINCIDVNRLVSPMKARGMSLAAAAFLGILAALSLLLVDFRRRSADANPRRDWLAEINEAHDRREQEVLRKKAVLSLLGAVRRADSAHQRFYRAVWPFLPTPIQNRITPPQTQDRYLFLTTSKLLGALATVPQLLTALKDLNREVRLCAIWALMEIPSEKGSNEMIDRVAQLLKDPEVDVRVSAALMIARHRPERVEIVPGFVEGLKGVGVRRRISDCLRTNAPNVLAQFGTNAQPAVPELRKLLRWGGNTEAAIALWRIARDTNGLPVLINEIQTRRWLGPPDHPICEKALDLLAEMGPLAKAATPALQTMLIGPGGLGYDGDRTNIYEKARLALRRIDPDAEKRLSRYYWR